MIYAKNLRTNEIETFENKTELLQVSNKNYYFTQLNVEAERLATFAAENKGRDCFKLNLEDLKLYLAWEFGVKNGIKYFNAIKARSEDGITGWYYAVTHLTKNTKPKTRRKGVCQHMANAINFQRGKVGGQLKAIHFYNKVIGKIIL